MIEGMIYGLIGAWFLSLFGVDNIFVEALQPFVNFTLTTSHYYFVFGFVGMISEIISNYKHKQRNSIVFLCYDAISYAIMLFRVTLVAFQQVNGSNQSDCFR